MPLTDMTDMLTHAHRHGYALGAFAVRDLESLNGVMAAAETSRAPVLLIPEAADWSRLELLLPAVEAAARRAEVPVAIQIAIAADPEAAARAIRLGCNGIRITPTEESFPRCVQQTQAVAATARACGLASEAAPHADTVGTAAEARRFIDRSEVDGLRLDLPSGASGSNGSRKHRLDYNRLKQVHQALDMPLSVDAGNDLSEDQCHRLIRHGVAAIGYRVHPSEVAGDRIRANCYAGDEALSGLTEAVAAEAEKRMRAWGAAGRAAEVLAQCADWEAAEQVVLCNFPEASQGEIGSALAQGEHLLGGIPGVREAVGMVAVSDDTAYRYAWRVRLCHPAALTSFQDHPDHAACANGGIHPASQGFTGVQYRRIGSVGSAPATAGSSANAAASMSKVATLEPSNRRNPA